MKRYRIAVLPGDGIGPEVTKAGLAVLSAVESRLSGVSFEFTEYAVGAAEYLRSGDPLPEATLQAVQEHDAILLGAMGLPNVRWPSGVEMTPQIDLRERLDLYRGLRPIRLYHAAHSPLKRAAVGGIDFMLVRENCEGLFSARKEQPARDSQRETDVMTITRHGAERILRAAFDIARQRRGRVTLVDKANVLKSMAFFRRIFDELAEGYPDVETERIYVDAMALYLVQDPGRFDVIVTENMFGDILSDLAAGLVGGMGMAPSGDVGDRFAVFQPAHGSAPDIAGKGWANPVATILSVAMMLDWLKDPETVRGARMIQSAVETGMQDSANRTRDLGGEASTDQITERIVTCIQNS